MLEHMRFTMRLVPEGECLVWAAGGFKSGYGAVQIRGRKWATHRLAWTLANGHIPEGMCVCHRCDNRRCCRTEHLFLGTIADNNRDMWSKGRGKHAVMPGERHPACRLSEENVRDIRAELASGRHGTGARLSRRYGVSEAMISNIKHGKAWTHF
jgi:hypothetical protein